MSRAPGSASPGVNENGKRKLRPVVHPITRAPAGAAVVLSTIWALMPSPAAERPFATISTHVAVAAPAIAAPQKADSFQFPLPTWKPHCLGFGSQWRLCDGTVLRRCAATGAIWLHTGVDIRTGIQPVRAAANGVIVGYTVDPVLSMGKRISKP